MREREYWNMDENENENLILLFIFSEEKKNRLRKEKRLLRRKTNFDQIYGDILTENIIKWILSRVSCGFENKNSFKTVDIRVYRYSYRIIINDVSLTYIPWHGKKEREKKLRIFIVMILLINKLWNFIYLNVFICF